MPSPFAQRVYELLREIPRGKVTTYGALACAPGRPKAARAVGRCFNANERPDYYPCYKVVHADGRLGGYGGSDGTPKKTRLLRQDGIHVTSDRVCDLVAVLHTFQ